MHIRLILFALMGILLSLTFNPTAASAQTPTPFSHEIRLLLHGTKTLVPTPEGSNRPSVGFAVWLIEPNLLDPTPQAQTTAGLRLASSTGWLELLGGGVFSPTTETPVAPVFDVRAFAAPARHLHIFGEVSVYGDALYGFVQTDVSIRKSDGNVAAKLGVEVEGAKAWRGPGGFVAVGPHVIVPWGDHFTTVVALQVRGTHQPLGLPTPDLIGRLYAVIDF